MISVNTAAGLWNPGTPSPAIAYRVVPQAVGRVYYAEMAATPLLLWLQRKLSIFCHNNCVGSLSKAMRAAIFFALPPDHPLTRASALWLGRDAFSGEEFSQTPAGQFARREIRALTASPRRYGFHATLKAPFRLSADHTLEEIDEEIGSFCRSLAPVSIGQLRIERIRAFFALTPQEPAEAINMLAAEVVRHFDRFRAPLSANEIKRRPPHNLSLRQRENLEQWGYPYIFHDFRFHMTLTDAVPKDRRGAMQALLEKRFGELLGAPVVVDALSLFVEASESGNFTVRKRVTMSARRRSVDAA